MLTLPRRASRETNHIMVELAPDIWIDEGIAPLIEALWDQGYQTEWCCQGGEKNTTPMGNTWISQAYVSFASFDDGVRFMRAVHEALRPIGDPQRDFYVHSALYKLEITHRYGEDDEIDCGLGPGGCVRFTPEIEGWDILAITTNVFAKEKES